MALGNIQWRFQQPVDFSTQLDKIAERKQKIWAEIGKNLGSGVQGLHDKMIDEDLAKMMEGYNKDKVSPQIKVINDEIDSLTNRISEIDNQITELQTEKKKLENPEHADVIEGISDIKQSYDEVGVANV